MDKIRIEGITCRAHVGVTQEERETLQTIHVDLVLSLDLESASQSDDLDRTVDYARVVQKVIAEVEENPACLIETIAGRLCGILLQIPRIEAVKTVVRKYPALLTDRLDYVEVEMTRTASTELK